MRVVFRCGCLGVYDAQGLKGAPTCPAHGAAVARVSDVPAPRIVGAASGPLVTTQPLGPIAVSLSTAKE